MTHQLPLEVRFLKRYAGHLHTSGVPAHQFERMITAVADKLGFNCHVLSAPTSIFLSFQYQDDELEIIEAGGPLTIICGEEFSSIDDGMVLYRAENGSYHVLAHGAHNRKKLLEAAYRYCTRWVRLDI